MVGIQLTVPTNFIHARVSCARPSACTARRIRSGRRSMGSPGSFGCCCPSGHKHLSPASSARGSWASTAAAPPPMLISVAKWGISLGTDAVSTCQARNHTHELSPINPTTATSTSLQRQRKTICKRYITSRPVSVTRTSSSMRMPTPRYLSGALSFSIGTGGI
jgi:hypothetical protein